MFENIFKYILKINGFVNELIYIGCGGIQETKIEQQRKRRFKSELEKKIWDTNAITPGQNS